MLSRRQENLTGYLLLAIILIAALPAVAAEETPPTGELVTLETEARRFWPSGLLNLIDNPATTADWLSTFPGFPLSRKDRLVSFTSTDQANLILNKFAELSAPKQHLILLYGQEPAEIGLGQHYPSSFRIGGILSLGGQDSLVRWVHSFILRNFNSPPDNPPATLILFVGNPAIDLTKLEIPPSLEVVPKHVPPDGYTESLRTSGLPDDRIVPELNATRIAVERILALREQEQDNPSVQPVAKKAENGRIPLTEAVKEFNKMAADDILGCEQTPLTEAEVVAAIRLWQREKDSPVTDELFNEFKRIAETGELPHGAEFEVLRGMDPGEDHIFIGWWVRIMMPKPDGGTYSFPIRDRVMRSITIEQKLEEVTIALEQWPQGLGRSRLERYQEELRQRVEAKQDAKHDHKTKAP